MEYEQYKIKDQFWARMFWCFLLVTLIVATYNAYTARRTGRDIADILRITGGINAKYGIMYEYSTSRKRPDGPGWELDRSRGTWWRQK